MICTKLTDYELIYLIREGNEIALSLMFNKYEGYIWSIVCDFYVYNHKIEDLVQIGRVCLYRCIFGYNAEMKVSFFSYFSICLKRALGRELSNPYYNTPLSFHEDMIEYGSNLLPGLDIVLNKEEKEMFEYCFVMDFSLREYARLKKVSFYKMKLKYDRLLAKIKKNYGL